jgi:hypothetical protein
MPARHPLASVPALVRRRGRAVAAVKAKKPSLV